MALTDDDLDAIAARVWAARFGPTDDRETAGERLAHAADAATGADLSALEARIEAKLSRIETTIAEQGQ